MIKSRVQTQSRPGRSYCSAPGCYNFQVFTGGNGQRAVRRFTAVGIDLRKGLPLISPSLLSSRLKSLERAGVVERVERGKAVSYSLIEAVDELKPIIMQLGVWGHRWARSDLSALDVDPSLSMWGLDG